MKIRFLGEVRIKVKPLRADVFIKQVIESPNEKWHKEDHEQGIDNMIGVAESVFHIIQGS